VSNQNIINLYDRIKELSYTVGSGNFGLVGAANGFSSFGSVYSHNSLVFYAITDGTHYEVGSGIFLRADNDPEDGITYDTLVRNPMRSSNNNQLVSFPPGTKEVYVTYPATHAVLMGSGLGLQVPQRNRLAIWDSENILNSDANLVWDNNFKALGLQRNNPEYGVDVGGSGDLSSCVRATGYFVGPTGVYFKEFNGDDSNYPGGTQYQHFEKNRTDAYAVSNNLLSELTGSSAVIQLSGVVNQYILFKKQNAGTVFAGPPAACTPPCQPGYPSFRSLVLEDIPDLSSLYASFEDLVGASGALAALINQRTGEIDAELTGQYEDFSDELRDLILASGELIDDFIVAASGDIEAFLTVGLNNLSQILTSGTNSLNSFINTSSVIISDTEQDIADLLFNANDNVANLLLNSSTNIDTFLTSSSGRVDNFITESQSKLDICCPITKSVYGVTIPSISGNQTYLHSFSVSGVVSGDPYAVSVSPSHQLQSNVLLTYSFPSNDDEISSMFYNFSSQDSDPQVLDFYISVNKVE